MEPAYVVRPAVFGHNLPSEAFMKEETIKRIIRFSEDRDWDRFHTPANLAKSISIEANELLECFQWSDEGYDIAEVRDELADVMVYCLDLLFKLGLDADVSRPPPRQASSFLFLFGFEAESGTRRCERWQAADAPTTKNDCR